MPSVAPSLSIPVKAFIHVVKVLCTATGLKMGRESEVILQGSHCDVQSCHTETADTRSHTSPTLFNPSDSSDTFSEWVFLLFPRPRKSSQPTNDCLRKPIEYY